MMSDRLGVDFQQRVLDSAGHYGPAESFLRRAVFHIIKFEGDCVHSAHGSERAEIALRVLHGGRVGLAASSLCPGNTAAQQLVERAVALAATGSRRETILAPLTTPVPVVQTSRPTIGDAKLALSEFLREQKRTLPDVHWSGRISLRAQRSRVIHCGGLQAESTFSEVHFHLRGQRHGRGSPIDRLMDVNSSSLEEAMREAAKRVELEFPPHESANSGVEIGLAVGFGPDIVGKLLGAWLGRWAKGIANSGKLDERLDIEDEPAGRYGADDEGIALRKLPVIVGGVPAEPWVTVGEFGRVASGRAIRSAIDEPPRPRAMGLRWTGAGSQWPERSVLICELAGMNLSPDGLVTGIAVETIRLEGNRPVARCAGMPVRLPLVQLLTTGLVGVGLERLAAGWHRLPVITTARIA